MNILNCCKRKNTSKTQPNINHKKENVISLVTEGQIIHENSDKPVSNIENSQNKIEQSPKENFVPQGEVENIDENKEKSNFKETGLIDIKEDKKIDNIEGGTSNTNLKSSQIEANHLEEWKKEEKEEQKIVEDNNPEENKNLVGQPVSLELKESESPLKENSPPKLDIENMRKELNQNELESMILKQKNDREIYVGVVLGDITEQLTDYIGKNNE